MPEYLARVDVTQSRYQTNLKNLMSNIRTRPTLVLRQCAEYLNIDEAGMRTRFANAITAIGEYKESLADAGSTNEKEETP